ncbi:transposase [Streptomyces sp. NPDC091215]|uniref:transposase n=1 Tax=Streptomyces sp. NPDC091215 TaxID=3155192 RepID=UPI00343ED8E5
MPGGSGRGPGRSCRLSNGRCGPLSLMITAGRRADCTQFQAVLDKIRVPRPVGWSRIKPVSIAADKAYSNGQIRRYLRRRGIRHTISEKTDSRVARLRKRSRGGRPPGFDPQRYAKRNTIEQMINKLKQLRAAATRYDKHGYVFLGAVTFVSLVIWLRT